MAIDVCKNAVLIVSRLPIHIQKLIVASFDLCCIPSTTTARRLIGTHPQWTRPVEVYPLE